MVRSASLILIFPALVLIASSAGSAQPLDNAISINRTTTQVPAAAVHDVSVDAASTSNDPRIEVDVSTRSVSVTSAFTGTEIVVFGAIAGRGVAEENDQSPYDIIIVVEGTSSPLVARRKSSVAGIWINTREMRFDSVPSYYAIASTKPISAIAPRRVLRARGIGFDHVRLEPMSDEGERIGPNELAEFREAVVRLKKKEGLYKEVQSGVELMGQSLFRATVNLPANVPVGRLVTKVFLFENGRFVTESDSLVEMQRQGLEAVIHDLAFNRPLLYGIFTVVLAVLSGLAASAIFRTRTG